ncbi:MAG: threonine aldolase family protein [Alphaproteobacteria bacterium]
MTLAGTMDFTSDNAVGAAPEIIAAIAAANADPAPSYGADPWSLAAIEALRGLFECPQMAVFFVATGSAANALALAALTPPHGAVLCHEASHIQTDECGAPEFFTHGAKLIPLAGDGAKLDPDTVDRALTFLPRGVVHHVQAHALSLTQASECGTVYTPTEVSALARVAKAAGLRVHMDGARFANALVGLDCAPADLTWRAGVDVLSLGATKNGALAAEAVLFFDPDLACQTNFARKRSGHLLSKGRFLGAQWQAYLADGLWLDLAAKANARAKALSQGLAAVPGVTLAYPTQANEVFAVFPDGFAQPLLDAGARFYPWVVPGDPAGGRMVRLVTSFATEADAVDRFLDLARSVSRQSSGAARS